MHEIEVNTQVIHRRKITTGKLVRIGTVQSFADNGTKAMVSFPGSRTRELLPLASLEPVSARFHKSRVDIDPIRRAVLTGTF